MQPARIFTLCGRRSIKSKETTERETAFPRHIAMTIRQTAAQTEPL